ncbi:MAG: hypothetical protein EXR72_15910 [Myxococcales bacterium]|nr:hypothetical protein [Myxococcales bacterium]
MGRILSSYADVVVMRHPDLGAARRLSSTATIPVINAGDGAGEHPTQALVDVFTIREAFGSFKGLRVGLCGDLLNGRTIHSLLRLLVSFGCQIVAICPEELGIPREILNKIPHGADGVRVEPDLRKVIHEIDVLYMTRVQRSGSTTSTSTSGSRTATASPALTSRTPPTTCGSCTRCRASTRSTPTSTPTRGRSTSPSPPTASRCGWRCSPPSSASRTASTTARPSRRTSERATGR